MYKVVAKLTLKLLEVEEMQPSSIIWGETVIFTFLPEIDIQLMTVCKKQQIKIFNVSYGSTANQTSINTISQSHA